LLSEEVDIALVYAPFQDERIVTRPMFSEPRVAVLPQSHRLAAAQCISVDDLLDEPFATADVGAPAGWAAYWACDERRGEPGRVATTVRSAREGLMATAWLGAVDTVPDTFARRSPHPGVAYVPLKDATPSTVVAAWRRNDQRPHIAAFDLAVHRTLDAHLHLVPGAQAVTESTS
jgi:DNA-binding transcriptional LysR family regulator